MGLFCLILPRRTAEPVIAFAKRLVAGAPTYEMGFTRDRGSVDFFREFVKAVP
jgi:hypothetical protein